MADNVHTFPGEYDSEAVADLVNGICDSDDVRRVYDAVEYFAAMSPGDMAYWSDVLKKHFRKRLDMRQFGAQVREYQRERLRSAQSGARRIRIADVRDDDPRPRVCLGKRELAALADEVIGHLARVTDPAHRIYRQDSRLVRIRKQPSGHSVAEAVDVDILTYIIASTMVCYTVDDSERGSPCTPPKELVRAVLAHHALPFPALLGIASGPILRPDGTICAEHGYDASTGIYCDPAADLKLPDIPEKPTQADAQAAAAMLLDTLCDMPFEDAAGAANLLATALTIPLRHVIRGSTPLCAITATKQGSGKSLLAQWAVTVGTGMPAEDNGGFTSWPNDNADEQRKKLESSIAAGDTLILYDNIRGVIYCTALEAMLTSPSYRLRLLRTNDQPSMPIRATWIFTGNGMRLGGDLYRRAYFVRINPGSSRPETRDPRGFKYGNLEDYLREHRGELLAAALTMCAAWYAAGCPESTSRKVLGGFQGWIDTLAGVLEYAGVSGFLATLDDDKAAADEDSQEWELFLLMAHEHTHGDTFEVRDLAAQIAAEPDGDLARVLPQALYRDLGKMDHSFHVRFGEAFKNRDGRRYGASGVYAEVAGENTHRKTKRWRIVLPTDATPEPEQPEQPEQPEPVDPPTYFTEPWYDATRPDSPVSQAMAWAVEPADIPTLGGPWLDSAQLQHAFRTGGVVVKLSGGRALGPRQFAVQLRQLYLERQYGKIRALASYLKVDAARVVPSMAEVHA